MNKTGLSRTSPETQWLRLCAPSEEGMGIIPGWGTKVLHAIRCSQKEKKTRQVFPPGAHSTEGVGTKLHAVPSCSRQSLSSREPLLRLRAQGILRMLAVLMLVKILPLQQDHSVLVFKASDSAQQQADAQSTLMQCLS